jgi:hypothetical protein
MRTRTCLSPGRHLPITRLCASTRSVLPPIRSAQALVRPLPSTHRFRSVPARTSSRSGRPTQPLSLLSMIHLICTPPITRSRVCNSLLPLPLLLPILPLPALPQMLPAPAKWRALQMTIFGANNTVHPHPFARSILFCVHAFLCCVRALCLSLFCMAYIHRFSFISSSMHSTVAHGDSWSYLPFVLAD